MPCTQEHLDKLLKRHKSLMVAGVIMAMANTVSAFLFGNALPVAAGNALAMALLSFCSNKEPKRFCLAYVLYGFSLALLLPATAFSVFSTLSHRSFIIIPGLALGIIQIFCIIQCFGIAIIAKKLQKEQNSVEMVDVESGPSQETEQTSELLEKQPATTPAPIYIAAPHLYPDPSTQYPYMAGMPNFPQPVPFFVDANGNPIAINFAPIPVLQAPTSDITQ